MSKRILLKIVQVLSFRNSLWKSWNLSLWSHKSYARRKSTIWSTGYKLCGKTAFFTIRFVTVFYYIVLLANIFIKHLRLNACQMFKSFIESQDECKGWKFLIALISSTTSDLTVTSKFAPFSQNFKPQFTRDKFLSQLVPLKILRLLKITTFMLWIREMWRCNFAAVPM